MRTLRNHIMFAALAAALLAVGITVPSQAVAGVVYSD